MKKNETNLFLENVNNLTKQDVENALFLKSVRGYLGMDLSYNWDYTLEDFTPDVYLDDLLKITPETNLKSKQAHFIKRKNDMKAKRRKIELANHVENRTSKKVKRIKRFYTVSSNNKGKKKEYIKYRNGIVYKIPSRSKLLEIQEAKIQKNLIRLELGSYNREYLTNYAETERQYIMDYPEYNREEFYM